MPFLLFLGIDKKMWHLAGLWQGGIIFCGSSGGLCQHFNLPLFLKKQLGIKLYTEKQMRGRMAKHFLYYMLKIVKSHYTLLTNRELTCFWESTSEQSISVEGVFKGIDGTWKSKEKNTSLVDDLYVCAFICSTFSSILQILTFLVYSLLLTSCPFIF